MAAHRTVSRGLTRTAVLPLCMPWIVPWFCNVCVAGSAPLELDLRGSAPPSNSTIEAYVTDYCAPLIETAEGGALAKDLRALAHDTDLLADAEAKLKSMQSPKDEFETTDHYQSRQQEGAVAAARVDALKSRISESTVVHRIAAVVRAATPRVSLRVRCTDVRFDADSLAFTMHIRVPVESSKVVTGDFVGPYMANGTREERAIDVEPLGVNTVVSIGVESVDAGRRVKETLVRDGIHIEGDACIRATSETKPIPYSFPSDGVTSLHKERCTISFREESLRFGLNSLVESGALRWSYTK